ncbi:hypothetical protein KAR91_68255 [Candidatus Pacearchaeota archaeon]|nr:hypothetical protein [Candidatus Pacearchaeota archaeon]
MSKSKCIVCNKAFKEGDMLQAFLRCPEDPDGSWTAPIGVDRGYQERSERNNDTIRRKHLACKSSLKGKFDGCDSPLAELIRNNHN